MKIFLKHYKSDKVKCFNAVLLISLLIFYFSHLFDYSYQTDLHRVRPVIGLISILSLTSLYAIFRLQDISTFMKIIFGLLIFSALYGLIIEYLQAPIINFWSFDKWKATLLPFLCIFVFTTSYISGLAFLEKKQLKQAFFITWLVLLIGFGWDIISRGDLNGAYGRHGSFPINPNMSSYLLIFSAFMAISWEEMKKRETLILLITFIIILFSFSMGSFSCFCSTCFLYLYAHARQYQNGFTFFIKYIGLFLITYFIVIDFLNSLAILHYETRTGETFFLSLFSNSFITDYLKEIPLPRNRLDLYQGTINYSMFSQRIDLFWSSIDLFLKNPIWGYGAYYLDILETKTHNFILHLLVSQGLVGFFIIMIYAFSMLKLLIEQKNIQLYGIALIILSNIIFDHRFLEFPALWLAQGFIFSTFIRKQKTTP